MNKTIYIAPEVEQISVRFEENIMSGNVKGVTVQDYEWDTTEKDW